MKIRILLLFSLASFVSFAQDKPSLIYQSTMLGFGNTSVYDTYLSPLEYKGSNIGLIHERMKMTGLFNGNVSAQHLFNLELAQADNPAKTATNYMGSLEYGYGLHYHLNLFPVEKLKILAGLQASGLIGGIYNTRNGNNPATAKVNLNLNLSGMASYQWKIKKQPIQLRYQLNVPFIGTMYAPEFGLSYYEMDASGYNGLFHFASFHNQLAMRNLLSVELPFNSCTVRLSYQNWIYETRINDLKTRIASNSIYIGFSKNFFTVSGRKQNNNYRSVFE